ncbi:hypothetical protein [Microbacterium sp. H83]|uniref:hypothetical protein n=1 Tax=Microbacterium sp. H83 TaxID=1827324 RepID=UPI0007F3F9C6|nr:hypothetical protein [Microbacterium sp. H83]OAN41399.1 hypothetical protein A4X16_11195 [Microbacterium sp. H83]
MDLEITSTPRATHVWTPSDQQSDELRRELTEYSFLVRDADPWELDEAGFIPEGQQHEFDPTRIFEVAIGADANATLQALVDSGHRLVWHRWQTRLSRKIWGVSVAIPPMTDRLVPAIDRAEHFGLKVRGSRELGLRMTREAYARINKRSSLAPWFREDDPELWDALDERYEDAQHRFYTDEWCAALQAEALEDFDLNRAHFALLDRDEFEQALRLAVKSQRGMVEVTDLAQWDGVRGLFVMVLDEYRQAYVGATDHPGGIMTRIKQHWARTKSLDRLVWGDAETSIISIDSFRALDTTRIFAAKSAR